MSGRRPYSYSSRTIPVRTQSNKQAEGVEPPFGVSPGGGLDAMARVRAVDETHSAGFAHEFDTINRASLSRFLETGTAFTDDRRARAQAPQCVPETCPRCLTRNKITL